MMTNTIKTPASIYLVILKCFAIWKLFHVFWGYTVFVHLIFFQYHVEQYDVIKKKFRMFTANYITVQVTEYTCTCIGDDSASVTQSFVRFVFIFSILRCEKFWSEFCLKTFVFVLLSLFMAYRMMANTQTYFFKNIRLSYGFQEIACGVCFQWAGNCVIERKPLWFKEISRFTLIQELSITSNHLKGPR